MSADVDEIRRMLGVNNPYKLVTVDEIGIFEKGIDGDPCPRCNQSSRYLSTTSEWKYHCPSCNVRFNDNGEVYEG